MGIGDWGLGIVGWVPVPRPIPQCPYPHAQYPFFDKVEDLGAWGWGRGVGGVGIGNSAPLPSPHPQCPNPQSPIPKFYFEININYFF